MLPSSSGLGCRTFNPGDVGSNPTGSAIMLSWINWLDRRPLKAKTAGSSPAGSTIVS